MEIPAEEISIRQIVRYYESSEEAIRLFFQDTNPLFANHTREELNIEYQLLIDELDKSTSLTILAAIEASFRLDYIERSKIKGRDTLTKSLKELYSDKKKKVSLPDEILRRWKKESTEKRFISDFISALNYRDWLAHGRYWTARVGRRYDFYEVYSLAVSLERSLGLNLDAV